jgi:phosphatidylserine synthase
MLKLGADLLILKLTVVPLALLLFGIADRLHGPRIAGWLAGFPIVAGPLLLFVTLEQGKDFGSAAALGAYFGLVPWLTFTTSYAWCSRFWGWMGCTIAAFAVWTAVAFAAVILEHGSRWLEILPFAIQVCAVCLYPRGEASDEEREHVWWGLPARAVAGAALTVVITQFAGVLGTSWSGIFTTFPIMGSIIAISSHVQYGRHAVQEVVAGMTMGLASVGAFCFALYLLLQMTGIWTAFGLSLAISSTVHALTWQLFKRKSKKTG